MKILITGAHFTVAQAVTEELQKFGNVIPAKAGIQEILKQVQDDKNGSQIERGMTNQENDKKIEIVYVGRSHTIEGDNTPSVESQVLPELGVKFIPITTGRLRRYISLQTFLSLFKIPIGFIQAFYILLKEKPDIIVSFGGYVGVPVVISAWLLSIPIIIHEQTLVSGLANTITSFFADKIAVSFETDYHFPKSKMVVTGNPMRKEILSPTDVDPEIKELITKNNKKPIILITGGNQGSHVINEVVSKSLKDLTDLGLVIHQTGDSEYHDFEKLTEQKQELKKPDNYFVTKWLAASSMGYVLRHATLGVSRAGMNTLLEFAYFGVPCILIPIDYLNKDEQNVNARFFQKLGLAEIISQKDLTKHSLIKVIHDILDNIEDKKESAKASKRIAIPDSAKILTQLILTTNTQNV